MHLGASVTQITETEDRVVVGLVDGRSVAGSLFLRVGKLVFGKRVNGGAQYLAIQPVLCLEVVINCGLVEPSRRPSDWAYTQPPNA